MDRKNFLKRFGFLGLTPLLPLSSLQAAVSQRARVAIETGEGCVLIPSETRGPYPLDLSKDATKFRQAINEDKKGLPLDLTLTIVNVNDNCKPIPNVRVDVWHCDKDGVYSGYNQPGANTVGQTFCRGIQLSDANGLVKFTTVYPGWYNGRTTHIHFEMYVSSVLSATSQLCFPDALNSKVYATSQYSGHGQNTSISSNSADNVFNDGSDYQLATVTDNESTGGYDASHIVGIAMKTSGLALLEPETGGQFSLQQNVPNPASESTVIPFQLHSAAHVTLELFDLHGKRVAVLLDEMRDEGDYRVSVPHSLANTELTDGCYVYQLSTVNGSGRFHQCKVMTLY